MLSEHVNVGVRSAIRPLEDARYELTCRHRHRVILERDAIRAIECLGRLDRLANSDRALAGRERASVGKRIVVRHRGLVGAADEAAFGIERGWLGLERKIALPAIARIVRVAEAA